MDQLSDELARLASAEQELRAELEALRMLSGEGAKSARAQGSLRGSAERPELEVVRLEPGVVPQGPDLGVDSGRESGGVTGADAAGAVSTDADEPRPEIVVHGDKIKTRNLDDDAKGGARAGGK